MSIIARALVWAAVIILVAVAGREGVIGADAARTTVLVLPIVAILTMGRVGKCGARQEVGT